MNLNFRTTLMVLSLMICVVLLTGCGQSFRPTIIPVFKPGGDPSNLGQAVVLSTNPIGNGSTMHINVSGDTNVGVVSVGPNPVFLGRSLNQAVAVNNTSATIYIALLPTSAAVNTVTLPGSSSGAVASGLGNGNNVYVANSATNNVTLIPGGGIVATANIAVGSQPVAVAGVSGVTGTGANKIYVVNQGSNDVTVISAIDNSIVKASIMVGSQPIWAVMSTDTGAVYVVNQGSGTVSVIDTGIDSVVATIPVGTSPNFAFFDPRLKRVYVTNTGSSSLSVIKGDTINLGAGIVPTKIADITLSGAAVSVTALSDGTRAYAALGGCPTGTNHTTLVGSLASCTGNRVSVIDVVALRETKTITVGSGAVSVDASSDATRVYAVNANSQSVSVIRTGTDTELQRMATPQQDLICVTNPTFTCPLQTPFMVRTFP
jgi:YVTN family beta-propeller protein